MLVSQKGSKGFFRGLDLTTLSQNHTWVESPLGTYHPYLFHHQKPKILQQRLEERRISWKNFKQISFSSNRIVDHLEKCGLLLIFSVVLGLLDQLQIFWQLHLIELLGFLTSLGLLQLYHLIYSSLLTGFDILVLYTNLSLMEFKGRYLA